MLAPIVKEQGFRATLALIIARARADRVEVAPIIFACGWTLGSPYTSDVDAWRILARSRLASPSMLMAPWTLVFVVCTGSCWPRIGAGWIDDTAVTPLHPVRRASRRNDGLGRLMQIAALVPYCAMLRSFYSDFRSAAPMLTSGAFESRPTTSLIPGSSRSLWTIVSAIRAVRFATPSLL